MNPDRSRLRFVIGGAALTVGLATPIGSVARGAPSRLITVYKNPT